jgi:zinc transport system ATP-binding protein
MAIVLSVKNLSVTFDDKPVIHHLDFELEKGESLAIIGPNGSGKTVLLRALMGSVPFSGKIAWQPNVRIGYVPQKIDADRHLPITIQNLLSAKAHTLGLPSSEITWAIRSAGLTEKIQQTSVGHLSGGQFQRALIAFALLGHPDVMLLDEPTASIDEPGEYQIYELIHELQDEIGMTAVLVSHDLSFVYRYAAKVLCLNKTNVCFGAPQEALTPQVLEKLYGGSRKYYHHLHSEH